MTNQLYQRVRLADTGLTWPLRALYPQSFHSYDKSTLPTCDTFPNWSDATPESVSSFLVAKSVHFLPFACFWHFGGGEFLYVTPFCYFCFRVFIVFSFLSIRLDRQQTFCWCMSKFQERVFHIHLAWDLDDSVFNCTKWTSATKLKISNVVQTSISCCATEAGRIWGKKLPK